jgi:hypothetical protein
MDLIEPSLPLITKPMPLIPIMTTGILQGDIEAMMEANMGAVFQAHGLGHFMGLDTHDVGGRKGTPVFTQDGFKSLRCCRVLQPGKSLIFWVLLIVCVPVCMFICN